MRTIKIDDKWSFGCIDVNNGIKEDYQEAKIYRYGVVMTYTGNNLNVAMAQRIMELEDLVKDYSLQLSAAEKINDTTALIEKLEGMKSGMWLTATDRSKAYDKALNNVIKLLQEWNNASNGK